MAAGRGIALEPPPAPVVARMLREREFSALLAQAEHVTPDRWRMLVERLAVYTAELEAQHDSLEQARAEAEADAVRFERLFLGLPVGVLCLSTRGTIAHANPAAARLLGHSIGRLTGSMFEQFVVFGDRPRLRDRIQHPLPVPEELSLELLIDGDRRSVALHLASLPGLPGRPAEILIAVEDHSAERRLLRRLAHQVEHDPLTGLLSRTAFRSSLQRLVSRTERSTGVLFIDVDRFKWVNDTHGHEAGDLALQAIARALSEQVRVSDLVARVSGDEFAVALPDIPEPAVAMKTAESVVEALRDGVVVRGVSLPISVSVGVALSQGAGDAADALLKRADAAMYLAKDAGRATWRVFDDQLEAEMDAFYGARDRIRAALHDEQLRLCAQPIRRLADGALVGHELLLRIEEDDGALMLPASFLDVARTTGTLRPLGAWVRREALALLAAGRFGSDGFITLNVSPAELDLDLARDLVELHRSFGVAPGRVVVEVTEEAMLPGGGEARQALDELVAAGMRLALDDFGSGYASLAHLGELPLAWVKLDRELVTEHATGEGRVLRAILDLCGALDLDVIAEGIETEPQERMLREMGCGFGQGWRLGRPALLDRA